MADMEPAFAPCVNCISRPRVLKRWLATVTPSSTPISPCNKCVRGSKCIFPPTTAESDLYYDQMGAQQSTVLRRPRDKALPALPRSPPLIDFPPPERCTICLEHGVVFPRDTPTVGCHHPVEFCVSCMETYVCVGIKNGINVSCPTIGCLSEMDVSEIRASIGDGNKAEFEKYVINCSWCAEKRDRLASADFVRERSDTNFKTRQHWSGAGRQDVAQDRSTSEEARIQVLNYRIMLTLIKFGNRCISYCHLQRVFSANVFHTWYHLARGKDLRPVHRRTEESPKSTISWVKTERGLDQWKH